MKWLAILALKCGALRVSAIEVLCGCLKTVIPIFRLLPGHFMLMEGLHAEFMVTSFRGLPRDCEKCATREDHWLQAGWRKYPRYESDVLPARPMQIMTRCSHQPLLFPALRSLDWLHNFTVHDSGPYIACKGFWTCACLYTGSQLKKVAIDLTILC
ncbi:hypothetical protein IEO21_09471 [Rhodonia placenta]|uniref:Secreted protein n=1 Tax=Rhodonia placenta TaxID=104341 RepID=A0A8H7NUG1_9APHY|nr:hypothetical protein IEO21_09471 [Postia placenta]